MNRKKQGFAILLLTFDIEKAKAALKMFQSEHKISNNDQIIIGKYNAVRCVFTIIIMLLIFVG